MSGRLCSKDIKSDRCMCVYGSNNGKQEGRQAGRRRGSSHKNALFYNEKRTKSRANEERFFQRLFPLILTCLILTVKFCQWDLVWATICIRRTRALEWREGRWVAFWRVGEILKGKGELGIKNDMWMFPFDDR